MCEYIIIHGGNQDTPRLAHQAGWHYGVQFGYTAYDDVFMVDYVTPLDDEAAWQSYLAFCTEHKPPRALVADFRHEDEWITVNERTMQIAELGLTPVVVAKYPDALRLMPYSVCGIQTRVGVSVPVASGYMNDGHMPNRDEIAEYSRFGASREIHLLGGHPDQWAFLMKYYSDVAPVVSVDGNIMISQAAQYGKCWSEAGYWRELRGQGYTTDELVLTSMQAIPRYIKRVMNGTAYIRPSGRIDRCKSQLGLLPEQLLLAI